MVNTLTLLALEKPNVGFVCFLGISVVFIGLACLIGIISLMNALVSHKNPATKKDTHIHNENGSHTSKAAPASAPIENRGEIIAAVCAAVAEENGTDVSAIRVISFKKIN